MYPLTQQEMDRLVDECRKLRIPEGGFVSEDFEPYNDYVTNVLLTVLDLQMQNVVVDNSIRHYNKFRRDEVRSLDDLGGMLARFQDSPEGNKAAAQYLWGNNHWTRIGWLRGLVQFLREQDL